MPSPLSAPAALFGVCGFLTLLLLDLRRRRLALTKIPMKPLAILDILPPAATAGILLASAACLYPEAVAAGVLSLRSPLLLTMLLCLLVLPLFWSEGRKQIQFQRPTGLLFGEWLVFLGAGAIIIHTALFALPFLLAGGAIIAAVVPPFMKKYEGLRILESVGNHDQFTQPEYTPATPECPRPDLWKMLDSQTTEVEVLDFLKTLVTTVKPTLVVETGTFLGHGTVKLAEGLKQNGFGKVITIEFDAAIRARAQERFAASGLSPWIESRLESSLETNIDGTIDLLYSDSHLANREAEIRRLLPQLDPRGLLVVHDASSHFKIVRDAILRLEQEGLISAVLLSTPRGVAVAQRRAGRA